MRQLTSSDTPWQLWLDGRPDDDGSRDQVEVLSPIDGAVVARVEQATPADVDHAVRSGWESFRSLGETPRHVRAGWLRDAADALDEHVEAYIESLVLLIGKPRRLAAAEARRGSALLRLCADALSSLGGETLPLDAVPGGEGRFGFTQREPLGVVAAITPFNAPINLLLQKVAPAIAMGNAVVIKPAPETAVVTLQVVSALAEAIPSGLLSVVCGGPEIAQRLVQHPRVAAVSLTGGVAAGEAVHRAAGIKPVLLELGSNSPNLVLADADLAQAAGSIAPAAFGASGQQCISAQRVIVERSALEPFVAEFTAAARNLLVGDPSDPETDLGPMVHGRARERVVELIDDAEQQGAVVVLDGRREGLYLGPTILLDPDPAARLLTEEVFGPVAVVVSAGDVDEAIEIANDVDLGLQASCFTRDIGTALRTADRLEAGSVWINEATRFRLDTYPFGGVGRSGLGREGVRYAMEELSRLKFIGIRTS